MDVDLTSQPVTDMHCFSFAHNQMLTRSSLSKLFLAGGPMVMGFRPDVQEEGLSSSVAFRRLIHELSLLLGTRNWEPDVLRRRNEQARDFVGYVKMMFENAKIERAVLDNGI